MFAPSPRCRSVAVIHETGSTGRSRAALSSAPRIAMSGNDFRQRPMIRRACCSRMPLLVRRRIPESKMARPAEKGGAASPDPVDQPSPRSSAGCPPRGFDSVRRVRLPAAGCW